MYPSYRCRYEKCKILRFYSKVFWAESDLVVIACDESFYVLKFNRIAFQSALDRAGGFIPEGEGIEEALEVISEVNEG